MANDPIQATFLAALKIPPANRGRWLAHTCGDDHALRTKVTRLLENVDPADDPLEMGVGHLMATELFEETRSVKRDPAEADLISNSNEEAFCELSRIGNYEIKRQIGRGGMGIVYLAHRLPKGTPVALKLIATPGNAERMQDLFAREASILSRLSHKRLVRCIDFGFHQRQMYLAMEYIETCDFKGILATQSRESKIRLACGVASYALEGLQHAHENGIVHRDVKPANILVYLEKGRMKAKLADFSLAKNFEDAGFTTISQEGELKGTLAYIAPEQVENSRHANPACDIYSTAACLYYYLTMQTPYSSYDLPSSISLLDAILNRDPFPIQELDSTIPDDLASIIQRGLERDQSKRFRSAEEMRARLIPFVSRHH